ncbi:uroporphyrinogen-III synthase [Cellulomonas composti]|uniref:Uroporphyrinogen-III synthase n=1 Tax=Cellulomonas composti TaxID=266130 RepID=A0A511JDF8_9CELL|nr:uroporphyrinogen-III synthase [Cellulomonas composti]GEL96030.1 hypothetical protein CCO02nite_26880 [Cellulomonas composti]
MTGTGSATGPDGSAATGPVAGTGPDESAAAVPLAGTGPDESAAAGPLAGWRVLVPRPTAGQSGAVIALAAAGATPELVPLIAIEPPEPTQPLDDALLALGAGWYRWLVVTSGAAVPVLDARARAAGRTLASLLTDGAVQVAAVGPGTARALEDHAVPPTLTPRGPSTATTLVTQFPTAPTGGHPAAERREVHPDRPADAASPLVRPTNPATAAGQPEPTPDTAVGGEPAVGRREVHPDRPADAASYLASPTDPATAAGQPDPAARAAVGGQPAPERREVHPDRPDDAASHLDPASDAAVGGEPAAGQGEGHPVRPASAVSHLDTAINPADAAGQPEAAAGVAVGGEPAAGRREVHPDRADDAASHLDPASDAAVGGESAAGRGEVHPVRPASAVSHLDTAINPADAAGQPEAAAGVAVGGEPAAGRREGHPGRGEGGARVVFARGDLAASTVADGLRARGWQVDEVIAYRTVQAPPPSDEVRAAWRGGAIHAALLTSASTVRALVEHLGPPPTGTLLVAIGPTTAAEADRLGLELAATAEQQTMTGLVDALTRAAHGRAAAGADADERAAARADADERTARAQTTRELTTRERTAARGVGGVRDDGTRPQEAP